MALNRVMTVDDDRFDQLAYRRILKKTNAEIDLLPFQYATEALEYLKSPTRQPVDVILLDINMPRMDGFEFLEAAKTELENQIVIMVTTSMDPQDRSRAEIFAPVRGYFSKPLTTDDISAIDRLVTQQ
ncbi:response regulator [Tritonibacter scottomollicae]|uniref:response regulator n=1 Tax=Tritonibacter scottomollicae TaxID=483013 RepID=UPI003BAA3B2A